MTQISNMKQSEREIYDARFQTFLFKMIDVAKMPPREKYLYPIMDGVPFKDMEVALEMAIMERQKHKSNDNALPPLQE